MAFPQPDRQCFLVPEHPHPGDVGSRHGQDGAASQRPGLRRVSTFGVVIAVGRAAGENRPGVPESEISEHGSFVVGNLVEAGLPVQRGRAVEIVNPQPHFQLLRTHDHVPGTTGAVRAVEAPPALPYTAATAPLLTPARKPQQSTSRVQLSARTVEGTRGRDGQTGGGGAQLSATTWRTAGP